VPKRTKTERNRLETYLLIFNIILYLLSISFFEVTIDPNIEGFLELQYLEYT